MSRHIVPINTAIDILRANGVVAIPTETVYGLAGRISSAQAIASIFALKGRPADNPLIVHVGTMDEVYAIADVPPVAEMLLRTYWPGPCTVVLKHRGNVLPVITAGLDTVAVRMPAHPVAMELLVRLGEPLAAPSANVSGRPSPTTSQHVIHDFGNTVQVVEGGPCREGLESTVVRVLDDGSVVILRPGAVTRTMLRADGFRVEELAGTDDVRRSPGTRHRHYAPTARVVLCHTIEELVRRYGSGEAERVVLAPAESVLPTQLAHATRVLAPETLYAELRRADDLQASEILVLCTDAILHDEALMNRLNTAAQ